MEKQPIVDRDALVTVVSMACRNNNTSLTELDAEFVRLIADTINVKLDGTARYGTASWNRLGLRGLFADLDRKYVRLRRALWEEAGGLTSERLEDTCLDTAVIALFMLMEYQRARIAGGQ